MPQVNLTPQQQAIVDTANAQVASAKASLDAATQELTSRDTQAHTSFNSVMLCSGFKGKVKDFGILAANTCAPCNINCKDCGGMGGSQTMECHKRVSTFNNDYNSWSSYKQTVSGRLADYNSAKDHLNAILDSISKDPTIGQNADIIKHEIDGEKRKQIVKWVFFGLAALAIVVGAIFVGRKLLSGTSAA